MGDKDRWVLTLEAALAVDPGYAGGSAVCIMGSDLTQLTVLEFPFSWREL